MNLAAPDERRHEEPLHSVTRGAAQFLFRLVREGQRDMRDRDEPSVRARAEIYDPTIVGPRIRHRQFEIFALRLPQEPERGIQERTLYVLDVQAPEPLFGIHRAERGLIDIPRARGLALVFDAG